MEPWRDAYKDLLQKASRNASLFRNIDSMRRVLEDIVSLVFYVEAPKDKREWNNIRLCVHPDRHQGDERANFLSGLATFVSKCIYEDGQARDEEWWREIQQMLVTLERSCSSSFPMPVDWEPAGVSEACSRAGFMSNPCLACGIRFLGGKDKVSIVFKGAPPSYGCPSSPWMCAGCSSMELKAIPLELKQAVVATLLPIASDFVLKRHFPTSGGEKQTLFGYRHRVSRCTIFPTEQAGTYKWTPLPSQVIEPTPPPSSPKLQEVRMHDGQSLITDFVDDAAGGAARKSVTKSVRTRKPSKKSASTRKPVKKSVSHVTTLILEAVEAYRKTPKPGERYSCGYFNALSRELSPGRKKTTYFYPNLPKANKDHKSIFGSLLLKWILKNRKRNKAGQWHIRRKKRKGRLEVQAIFNKLSNLENIHAVCETMNL